MTTEMQEAPAEETQEKQTFIEGTQPVSIPEVEEAAEAFVAARDNWQQLGETMQERKDALKEAMVKHDLTEHRYDGKLIKIVPGKDNVKVNKVKDKPADE